jgi:hypothetical protein
MTLSIPSTISMTVSVTSAAQASGEVIHSMGGMVAGPDAEAGVLSGSGPVGGSRAGTTMHGT